MKCMKPTISLLCATTVWAVASPTKESLSVSGSVRFPKFSATIASTANTDLDSQIASDALKATFMKNGASKFAGNYHAFRCDALSVALNQETAKGTDGKAPASIVALSASKVGQKSFYESTKANSGDYYDASGATVTTAAHVEAMTYGPLIGACISAKIGATKWKECSSISMPYYKQASTAIKVSGIAGRIFFDNAQTASATCGEDTTTSCNFYKMDPDLILGAFYQSNGSTTAGEDWCSGSWYNEMESTATKSTLKGQTGFGPKGKCTWQLISKSNKHAPAFTLIATPKTDMLIQVIEWYNTATLTTGSIIDKAKAQLTPGFAGRGDSAYDETAGVYLNPATTVPSGSEATIVAFPNTSPFSTAYVQNNALGNIPNSIGTALYYERDAGQDKALIRNVDSTMFTNAYDVYNSIVKSYTSEKSTYDTKKTEYETAVEDRKKDPKKTLPARPNMPSQPGPYSGPQLFVSSQVIDTVTETWGTKIKDTLTGVDGVLATDKSNTGVLTYDQANVKANFHNRIGYVMASKTSAVTTAGLAGVGATFGRLGQGVSTTYENGAPFIWAKAVATAKPGMQVSLFPEYVRSGTTGAGWGDWTVSSTAPTLEYGVKAEAAMTTFDAPSQPGAATAITDSASQMVAATLLAASTIAFTLY